MKLINILSQCLNGVYMDEQITTDAMSKCNGGHRNSIYTCNLVVNNSRSKSLELEKQIHESIKGIRKLSLKNPAYTDLGLTMNNVLWEDSPPDDSTEPGKNEPIRLDSIS